MSPAPSRQPSARAFQLLLVSARPALRAFFGSLDAHGLGPLDLTVADAGTVESVDVAGLDAAVVDAGVDATAALDVVVRLRTRRDGLPLAAVVCCAHSINPWQLDSLLASGVTSVLDLQSSPDDAARALRAGAAGALVFHLHVRRGDRAFMRDVLTGRVSTNATKVRILELLAHGLRDHEIGARLHLSPHTVKHHIDDLREEVGARNRIELAAWAGRHGFYRDEADAVVPVELVRPTR